jgi:hypothetical protein
LMSARLELLPPGGGVRLPVVDEGPALHRIRQSREVPLCDLRLCTKLVPAVVIDVVGYKTFVVPSVFGRNLQCQS